MSVLLWWLVPIAATAVAIGWVWWRGREGAAEAGKVTSPKELDKMGRALNRPIPGREVPSQQQRSNESTAEAGQRAKGDGPT